MNTYRITITYNRKYPLAWFSLWSMNINRRDRVNEYRSNPLRIIQRNRPIHQSFTRERRCNLWWIGCSVLRLGVSITVNSQLSALKTIMFSRACMVQLGRDKIDFSLITKRQLCVTSCVRMNDGINSFGRVFNGLSRVEGPRCIPLSFAVPIVPRGALINVN